MAETLARKPESGDGTLALSDGSVNSSVNGIVFNNGTLSETILLTGELAANLGEAKKGDWRTEHFGSRTTAAGWAQKGFTTTTLPPA